MIINNSKINFYMIFIALSQIISIIYIIYHLKKDKINPRDIKYSLLLVIPFSLIGGILLTMMTSTKKALTLGFSSYGGLFGMLIAVLLYEKISENKKIKDRYLITLPLIYSISKIGCLLAGCCYGIPYKGPFYVIYPSKLNIKLFPVQLLETILFLIIFIIMNYLYNKKHKNIIEITFIISALTKFLTDYLRYSHINQVISLNQIISLIIIIITIIILIYKHKKDMIK